MRASLVVFDLDNTLYDWYSAFIPAFYAMVNVACDILGCDADTLLDELRAVHIRHHDVEHPFGLVETPTVQAIVRRHGIASVRRLLDPAFHAFNKSRKQNLVLFPHVESTLDDLLTRGIQLAAFTDSKFYSTVGRLQRLNLANKFSRVYCRARGVGSSLGSLRQPDEDLVRRVRELPPNETKPDPAVLIDIAAAEGASISAIAYVGDSVAKDVWMAKQAGCAAVWAKYGSRPPHELYEKLVRISHWTPEDISRERRYAERAKQIQPDFVCEESIRELLIFI